MVTINEVKRRVEQLEERAEHDDEGAHGMEDKLWQDVLVTIAAMGGHQGELAKEALNTMNIKFRRWCG